MIITLYSSSPKVNIYPICKLQKQIKGQKWETSPLESLQLWRWAILKWVGPASVGTQCREREKKKRSKVQFWPSFPLFSHTLLCLEVNWNTAFWQTRWKRAAGIPSIHVSVMSITSRQRSVKLHESHWEHNRVYAHTRWKPVLQLAKETASANMA